MTIDRGLFCHRLMPALSLAASTGYLRNESTTRRLLGYDGGERGSKQFGHSLVEWSRRGFFEAETPKGCKRFTYRITKLGKQSVTSGQPVRRKPMEPSTKLRAYLEANPDEELSVDDAMIKFCITRRQALRAINRMICLGIAERINVIRAKK